MIRKIARKIRNYYFLWHENHLLHQPREKFLQWKPNRFLIETVAGCNLRCPECAIGAGLLQRKTGAMSFADYKIIADKIRPYAREVILVMWGEPLLNKDLIDIVRYTATFAKTVAISTNGNLMTQEKADQLIEAGLTNIIVSIDGTTQDVYEKYRIGGSLEKALAALKMLVEARKKFHRKVVIIPQFIVFGHNVHQMDKFRQVCAALGVRADFKSPYLRENSQLTESGLPELTRPAYADETERSQAMRHCTAARSDMTMLLDGTVVPCCVALDGECSFGNLLEQDLPDIWDSEKYRAFRWGLFSGTIPGFCRKNCLSYFLRRGAGK